MEYYYTVPQFSEKHQVTESYVCRLLRQGKLPGKKIGVQWFLGAEADIVWAERSRKRGGR